MYLSNLDAKLTDVRRLLACHLPDDYGPSQRLGRTWRAAGKDGVLYRSLWHDSGLCAGLFRPPVRGACTQSSHYAFHFDGAGIVAIDELSTAWTLRP